MAKRVFLGGIELATAGSTSETGGSSETKLSRFSNKILTISGDSITEHNFRATKNWHDYLKDWLGFGTVINDGVSGTGFTRTYGTSQSIYSRIDNWSTTTDYILVMASMNDGGGNNAALSLGSFSDTGVGTSYYGDCKAVINKLLAKYPEKPIGIITPPPRGTTGDRGLYYGITGWYEPWNEALLNVCANYSIPCLDMYHNSGLRPWITSNNAAFFSCDTSPSGDGTHPNAEGQKIMAYKIYKFVEQYI